MTCWDGKVRAVEVDGKVVYKPLRVEPSDGSNWENLCVYCHGDEHGRRLLADYFRKSQ